jgi:hypothetical protein
MRVTACNADVHLEVLLQLWDEMDDWLNAARHLLGRSMA